MATQEAPKAGYRSRLFHGLELAEGTMAFYFGLCARIWKDLRFAGCLRVRESGYTRFHEGERLDESTRLVWKTPSQELRRLRLYPRMSSKS